MRSLILVLGTLLAVANSLHLITGPFDLDIAVNTSANAYYFVGGYNPFIYVVQVALAAPNSISIVGRFPSGTNASFLSLLGSSLVAVNEVETFNGVANSGGITAFAISTANGRIQVKRTNSVPSRGTDPAFVTLAQTKQKKRMVLAANYGGGNYGSFEINQLSGAVAANPTSFYTDTGSGPRRDRQQSPHPHQITPDYQGKFVFVPDLGTDHIMQYVLNDDGSLTANSRAPSVAVAPGSGPRHLAFHPNGKWAYATNELGNRMDFYSYKSDIGTLTLTQGYSMISTDADASRSTAAEVKITRDGKFVYGSNRNGTDNIVIFKIDSSTGALTTVGWEKTRGSIPRYFTLTQQDKWLFVANQVSSNLVLFQRDPNSGKLTYLTQSQAGAIAQPTCIVRVKFQQ